MSELNEVPPPKPRIDSAETTALIWRNRELARVAEDRGDIRDARVESAKLGTWNPEPGTTS
jgi:hypothetical protein